MSEFDEDFNEFGDAPKEAKELSSQAGIADLDGRALVIFPRERKQMEPRDKDSKPYEAIFCDVIVLDGALDRKAAEVGITELPLTLTNFMFTSWQIRENLKPRLAAAAAGGKPVVPMLGRINSQKSQKNSGGRSYGIEAVDARKEPDLAKLALAQKRAYESAQAEDEFSA
jgi:hypothetical protein